MLPVAGLKGYRFGELRFAFGELGLLEQNSFQSFKVSSI